MRRPRINWNKAVLLGYSTQDKTELYRTGGRRLRVERSQEQGGSFYCNRVFALRYLLQSQPTPAGEQLLEARKREVGRIAAGLILGRD